MTPQQATGEWVQKPPQGSDRVWATYLPDNCDPTRVYPLVIQVHGCTGGTNNVPVERVSLLGLFLGVLGLVACANAGYPALKGESVLLIRK